MYYRNAMACRINWTAFSDLGVILHFDASNVLAIGSKMRNHRTNCKEYSPDRSRLKVIVWRNWDPIRPDGLLDVEGSEDRRDCDKYLHHVRHR